MVAPWAGQLARSVMISGPDFGNGGQARIALRVGVYVCDDV